MNTEDEEALQRMRAVTLVSEATGGNAYFMEQVSYADDVDRESVVSILREANVPIAAIVQYDLDKIFTGQRPLYFLSPREISVSYRERVVFNWPLTGGTPA